MYLKELEIINFRKFGKDGARINFVKNNAIKNKEQQDVFNSVAHSTTLIVGKNNSGKTTISSCLNKILNDIDVLGNDFNYSHIGEVIASHRDSESRVNYSMPYMRFVLLIGLDEESESESLHNFKHTLDVKSIEDGVFDFMLSISYEVKDEQFFIDRMQEIISQHSDNEDTLFRQTLSLISNTEFKKQVRNSAGTLLSNSEFSIKNALDLKLINSNFRNEKTDLSNIFNKIIKYKIKRQDEDRTPDDGRVDINKSISQINKLVKDNVSIPHSDFVNNVLHGIIDNGHLAVNLQPELTLDSILKDIITYEYKDKNHFIPESQFGLGYSNLIKIVGEIIDFIEKYEETQNSGKINLIFIEEPECFMHPQMQELFIKNIDDAIKAILENNNKLINVQLIITTHSPHILNSKIQNSGSFNNINYIKTTADNKCIIKPLRDNIIKLDSDVDNKDVHTSLLNENEFSFLKKHLKAKCADLFYADAIIMTEGITEETLLHYFIDRDPILSRKCISIFNINGAFAHIYKPLISFLEIPCLVITDIDIKREENSKEQISSLDGRTTTNAVINKYLKADNESFQLNNHLEPIKNDVFYIAFQNNAINGYFATSFEEALILTNYENKIVHNTLCTLFPIKAKQFDNDSEQLKERSYEWQRRLSSSKSDFANTLLFNMINGTSSQKFPVLPDYVNDGLSWLTSQLSQ
ncbi:AAA family ATPase [Aeromonas jandaei]|uniref:AAA family ATPase n=1 Tax=Aeromonas jandaei TaxID=650 RepID=UPI00191D8D79|nr:AAA family ATPase [Aeromonas jandaei]MBL0545247.1 AAA family ATPase [Aeromonas jandaei]